MSAIMKSISPKECERIANGEQTVLVSKTRPKIDTPFKCYIYCTKNKRQDEFITKSEAFGYLMAPEHTFCNRAKEYDANGKVIGEFVCDRIYEIKNLGSSFMIGNDIALTNRIARESCLEYPDLRTYLKDKKGYAWHISDLKIYDKPKPIMQFYKPCPIEIKNCPVCEFYSEYIGCCMNNVTRPPQSWYYVEEL